MCQPPPTFQFLHPSLSWRLLLVMDTLMGICAVWVGGWVGVGREKIWVRMCKGWWLLTVAERSSLAHP